MRTGINLHRVKKPESSFSDITVRLHTMTEMGHRIKGGFKIIRNVIELRRSINSSAQGFLKLISYLNFSHVFLPLSFYGHQAAYGEWCGLIKRPSVMCFSNLDLMLGLSRWVHMFTLPQDK